MIKDGNLPGICYVHHPECVEKKVRKKIKDNQNESKQPSLITGTPSDVPEPREVMCSLVSSSQLRVQAPKMRQRCAKDAP